MTDRRTPLERNPALPYLARMNHHSSFSPRAASWCAALGLALAGVAATSPAAAADLGPYGASHYSALPPSPCEIYAQSYNGALRSMRQTAGLFRHQEGEFHRLKRRRNNDGFAGPDIALNAVMSAEQIDVANWAAEVAISVEHARLDGCYSRARLNEIDNAASRLKLEIAEETIWIDPVTFR
jgi:hypothetical protein